MILNGSRRMANRLAEAIGGRRERCRVSFGAIRTCRYCVKATYEGLVLEGYVFSPRSEFWLQDVRLRCRTAFAVNRPSFGLGLRVSIADAFASCRAPVFADPGADTGDVRSFCADSRNEHDIAALVLGRTESLIVAPSQIILRNRTRDHDLILARLQTLGRLVRRHSRPRSRPLVEDEFEMIVGDAADTGGTDGHRWGGSLTPPMPCPQCSRPIHCLVTIDTQDSALPAIAGGGRRLPVVHCLRCQAASSPTAIQREGSRWRLLTHGGRDSFGDCPETIAERRLELRRVPRLLDRVRDHGARSGRHTLGGEPEWLQAADVPDCPVCGEPMRFLAQLGTDDRIGLQFGDDGRLYAFVCEPCHVVSSLLQSR
jgi:hypothetical protein